MFLKTIYKKKGVVQQLPMLYAGFFIRCEWEGGNTALCERRNEGSNVLCWWGNVFSGCYNVVFGR